MSGLTRHLLWDASGLKLDVYKAPREEAIYLLKVAAEVEHALMVQYLFAAWSLDARDHPQNAALVRSWRSTILEIAREEMGHLATVQNLLTLIGGALSFARDDSPASGDLFPFQFELQPLTKLSLAKYLLSEMPAKKVLKSRNLLEKIEKIRRQVPDGANKVHRVGILYDKIRSLFTAPQVFASRAADAAQFIAESDIQPAAAAFMVTPGQWGLGNQSLLIRAPSSRQEAIDAIAAISDQGEGSDIADFPQSHFARFLNIYDRFPRSGWKPARTLAKNPTTEKESGSRGLRIIAGQPTLNWAKLFNLRYRMLLMFMSHSFGIAAPANSTQKSPHSLLISWSFGEMYHLRSIAEFLMDLPLTPGSKHKAGPPFEMPISLALPMREADRWRLHRDFMSETEHYVAALLNGPGIGAAQNNYLLGLRHTNGVALQQAITMVGA